MNKNRICLFFNFVIAIGLCWGPGFPGNFDADAGKAWAKQTPSLTPAPILSPGRDLAPISLTLRTGEDLLMISQPEPKPNHRAADPRLVARIPNETGESSIRQTPVAKRAPGVENRSFEFKDGLLTLEAVQRPISEILGQIARAAGVEIILFDPIEAETISVKIAARPLEEALRYILKGLSHSVVYNCRKETQGVRIVQQYRLLAQPNARTAPPSLAAVRAGNGRQTVLMETKARDSTGTASTDQEKGSGRYREAAAAASESGKRGQAIGRVPSSAPSPQAPPQLASTNKSAQGQQAGIWKPNGGVAQEEQVKRLIAMYERRIASGQSDRDYDINMQLSGGGYYIEHDRDRVQLLKDVLEKNSRN